MKCYLCGMKLIGEGPGLHCPNCNPKPEPEPAVTGKGPRMVQTPEDLETARHMNLFLDELRWFYDHGIKIHLTPKPGGWSLQFSVPDNGEPCCAVCSGTHKDGECLKA